MNLVKQSGMKICKKIKLMAIKIDTHNFQGYLYCTLVVIIIVVVIRDKELVLLQEGRELLAHPGAHAQASEDGGRDFDESKLDVPHGLFQDGSRGAGGGRADVTASGEQERGEGRRQVGAGGMTHPQTSGEAINAATKGHF